MEWLDTALSLIRYILIALLMYGILLAVERLRPVEPHQPIRHILFNLQWCIFYACFGFFLGAINIEHLIQIATTWLRGPYIDFGVPNTRLETVVGIIGYFLAVDFFYYVFHRLQHRHPYLWELHKFHHSDVSLNVTSTQRVHWLEEPLVMVFITLPMALLFRLEPLALGMLALIELLWLLFIHMNFRVGFGIFAPILVSPQHHRIHHSTETPHLDKNFALFFPLWDIVFGSYYRPQKGEYPTTGLTTGETHTHLWPALRWSLRAVTNLGSKTSVSSTDH